MHHIQLTLSGAYSPQMKDEALQSRPDYVRMIQTIQGHGTANIWYFYISLGGMSACEAVRIGWLDIPTQPEGRGEWRFYDSYGSRIIMPMHGA